MTMAEIIEKTYVEYLPDGRKKRQIQGKIHPKKPT